MARNMTTGITRRGVVKGAAAAGLVLSTTGGARAQPLRQSVTAPDFRQATLDSYKRAIANMLALPPSDPRNWYRQAMIHVLDCPHENWWFLPWHRGYILNFERICRQLSGDPDFALPYWDWTATPQLPDMFFDDVLNPAGASYMDFNSLQDAFRGPMTDFMAALSADQMKSASARGFATVDDLMADIGSTFVPVANARALTRQSPALPDFAQQAVAINVILDTLGLTRFEDFASSSAMFHLDRPGAGQLESQPHNNVHGGVSGMMGDFMSPVDPIFWLHHANLDRLWGVWARGRGGQLGPDDASWGAEKFVFFVDQAGNPAPTDAMGASNPSGVQYQPGSGDNAVPAIAAATAALAAAAPRRPAPQIFNSTQAGQTLRVAQAVTMPVTVSPAVLQGLALRLGGGAAAAAAVVAPLTAMAPPAPSHLMARIRVTAPPRAQDYRLRVFVNCPYLSAGTPLSDAHYVGSIAFFGNHRHAGGGSSSTFTLLLNPALSRLLATGQYPGEQFRLQVMAATEKMEPQTLDARVEQVQIYAV
jgi:hypothetical protein